MMAFYFSPFGRAARVDYWYWLVLPFAAVAGVLVVLGPAVLGHRTSETFLLCLLVVFFVAHTMVGIKRLHDQSLSGWLSLALIPPFAALGAYVFDPTLVDIAALARASEAFRLVLLVGFTVVFVPFAFVLGSIWFVMGKDGKNRYGYDPLYR